MSFKWKAWHLSETHLKRSSIEWNRIINETKLIAPVGLIFLNNVIEQRAKLIKVLKQNVNLI